MSSFGKIVLKPSELVLSTVKFGKVIPFIQEPPSVYLNINKSAFNNSSFVLKAITELKLNGFITEVTNKPYVINPLTVVISDSKKERLVLDLRHVNNWIVPPVGLVCRVVNHMLTCRANGVLVVPKWKSALFWLMDSATWREISQFANSNQQFTGCEKSIFNIVRSSKAISTNKKYDVYFKKFKEWCITYKVIPLPASVSSVAVYISGLVQQSVSESVLLAHFYNIK
ncbi:unnamed protein product [Mytilus edulis]|uniref:Uncharacterized protein n=1 Tax=Mytilus edulis TaxID=6550 RepID=A0A8S3VEJ7_MYTED|nr:unnamed protein product [Mytilus edulis]